MRHKSYFAMLLITIFVTCFALSQENQQKDKGFAPDPTLNLLHATDKIKRVEIFYIDANSEFIQTLSPQDIEKNFDFKIQIQDYKRSHLCKDLVSVFENSHLKQIDKNPDLRWGCIFYGTNDDRI